MPGQHTRRPAVQPPALLDLAVSRPHEAMAAARALLQSRPVPLEVSYARQAAGIVLRDLGQLGPARRELRAALRAARAAGAPEREADVLASLAVALVLAGRTTAGLDAFEQSVALAGGPVLARVLVRRGAVLNLLGRHEAAVADLQAAAEQCRRTGDAGWEGRALLALSALHLAVGSVARADADAARAEALFDGAGQDLEAAKAVHNRGLAAFQAGRLPAALAHLARAEERYDALGVPVPELAQERCAVLLAAGLAGEAVQEVDDAIHQAPPATVRAELLLAGAAAALAAGDPAGARLRARQAERLFRGQTRPGSAARARFLGVAATAAAGSTTAAVRRAAAEVADVLSAQGALEAPLADLLAGRLALTADPAAARTHLLRAAAGRATQPALGRATGELAVALLARAEGRPSAVLRACTRGLATLDEHRMTLGSPDLRALAGGHGRELTELALAEVLRRGAPRALLRATERGRAAALAVPGVAPHEDADLGRELAALRDAARQLDLARAHGSPTAALTRVRDDRERAVRRRRHAAVGAGGRTGALDLGALLEALGQTRLVELVEVRGALHALVADRGRVRRLAVGPAASALTELAHAHAALRRAAHGRPPDLARVGARLQVALLGPAAALLRDGPVVVVPPGRLHAAPWGLLPALAPLPVSVAPSAALWLRAWRRPAPAYGPVLLVAGPGLGSGGAELGPLTGLHPGAVVLTGGAATAERVLAGLDGARLAHIAAHGDFRSDSPLFSSLRLDDGPLTVHDLERLRLPPYRLVLSACESGAAASVGSDDLLGLASALLGMGTAGVLASVVPVNDQASVAVACAVHAALAEGDDLASALLAARAAAGDDPLSAATAAAYLAIGV